MKNIQRIIFEYPEEIFEVLGANSEDYIGTSYVDRINLTIRTSLVRFVRRTMNFSKMMKMHTKAFDLFQAWYNFIKPHDSLKLRIDSKNRKLSQRTQQWQKE
ncbi:IS1 family transposase [Methanosarcina sp. DH1]|uniref:IS1 family transposase n=1 Tax=Methanosarcina sp. DH1 TaxID=2605695 RepID=UPI001E506C5E|nr:IS1 family transposase [Methanosarcina sp. DH1]